jgi:hypothetical protein
MIQQIHLGNPIQLLELREADFEKEAKIYLDHDATLRSAKEPSTQVVKMAGFCKSQHLSTPVSHRHDHTPDQTTSGASPEDNQKNWRKSSHVRITFKDFG